MPYDQLIFCHQTPFLSQDHLFRASFGFFIHFIYTVGIFSSIHLILCRQPSFHLQTGFLSHISLSSGFFSSINSILLIFSSTYCIRLTSDSFFRDPGVFSSFSSFHRQEVNFHLLSHCWLHRGLHLPHISSSIASISSSQCINDFLQTAPIAPASLSSSTSFFLQRPQPSSAGHIGSSQGLSPSVRLRFQVAFYFLMCSYRRSAFAWGSGLPRSDCFFGDPLLSPVVGTFLSEERKVHKRKTGLVILSEGMFGDRGPFRGPSIPSHTLDNITSPN